MRNVFGFIVLLMLVACFPKNIQREVSVKPQVSVGGKVSIADRRKGETFYSSDKLYASAFGTFSATGSMSAERCYHTATLLPNGKVLVAGSRNNGTGASLSSAELYDPATGTFTPTGSMSAAYGYHAATLLPNGKVLLTGGIGLSGIARSSAEVYDPASGTFSATGSMSAGRWGHTATLLPNGMVLVAGGDYLASAELYDPASGTFAVTGSMSAPRTWHTATLLPNGKVLVTGAESPGGTVLSSAELYDPAAGTFASAGSMSAVRCWHRATLLPDGRVLIVGGYTTGGASLSSAELYVPSHGRGSFSATGSMSAARYLHSAIMLPNGKVLVAGGMNPAPLSSAELYDPATGTFAPTGSMTAARQNPVAVLLPNKKVLVAGGVNFETPDRLVASADLYDPLRKGRPLSVKDAGSGNVAAIPAAKIEPAQPIRRPPVVSRSEAVKISGGTNLAVAEFIGKNVSQADASIVADFLRTELVNTGMFNVMDRTNMDTVLAEQKFQNSGCTEQECAVEMGKLLNVGQMIVGSLSKLVDSYYITVNLIDVETGKIVASYDSDASSSKELKDACRKLVKKISR